VGVGTPRTGVSTDRRSLSTSGPSTKKEGSPHWGSYHNIIDFIHETDQFIKKSSASGSVGYLSSLRKQLAKLQYKSKQLQEYIELHRDAMQGGSGYAYGRGQYGRAGEIVRRRGRREGDKKDEEMKLLAEGDDQPIVDLILTIDDQKKIISKIIELIKSTDDQESKRKTTDKDKQYGTKRIHTSTTQQGQAMNDKFMDIRKDPSTEYKFMEKRTDPSMKDKFMDIRKDPSMKDKFMDEKKDPSMKDELIPFMKDELLDGVTDPSTEDKFTDPRRDKFMDQMKDQSLKNQSMKDKFIDQRKGKLILSQQGHVIDPEIFRKITRIKQRLEQERESEQELVDPEEIQDDDPIDTETIEKMKDMECDEKQWKQQKEYMEELVPEIFRIKNQDTRIREEEFDSAILEQSKMLDENEQYIHKIQQEVEKHQGRIKRIKKRSKNKRRQRKKTLKKNKKKT